MKKNLIVLFIVGFLMLANGLAQESISKPEDWRVEQVSYQGEITFIRYNRALISLPKSNYPQLIRVTVKFKTENQNGFPNDSEAAGLWKLEDQLDDFLTKNCKAVFTGTITMPNRRHYIFYSPQSDSLEKTVTSFINSIKNYEIDHTVQLDTEWNVFKGFYER